jgi:hypothetical protein
MERDRSVDATAGRGRLGRIVVRGEFGPDLLRAVDTLNDVR